MVGCRVDQGLFPSLLPALAIGFRFCFFFLFFFVFFLCVCVCVRRLPFILNYKHYIPFFYRYLTVFLGLPYWDAYIKANSAEMGGRPLKRGHPDPYLQC